MGIRLNPGTRVHGLRTEMEGLREFMSVGRAGPGTQPGSDADEPRWDLELTPRAPEIRWVVHGSVLETTGPARTIAEHLAMHRSVESLLAVAFWCGIPVLSRQVLLRPDNHGNENPADPVENLLTSSDACSGAAGSVRSSPLFRHADGGAGLFETWATIWNERARVVRPLSSLPSLHCALLETRLLVAGTGIEALGYYLSLASTRSKQSAKDEPLAVKLERVVGSLPDAMGELLGAEPAPSFRTAYMAVKHADCQMPDRGDLHAAYAWGIQLFRLWVASQLAVPAAACAQQVLNDTVVDLSIRGGPE